MTRLHALPVGLIVLVVTAARVPSIPISRPVASELVSLDSACLSADTAAMNFLQWTKRNASGVDSTRVALRVRVGLPMTAADDVQLVTDDSICMRAALAVDSSAHVSSSSAGHVQVAKIGSGHFAVHRVGWAAGEWGEVFFFDSTFAPTSITILY